MIMANGRFRAIMLTALAVPAVLLAAAACGGDDDEDVNGGNGGNGATATPAGDGNGNGDGGGETTFDLNMHEEGGNVFELGDEKNPTLAVPAGEDITINLTNEGIAIHNMRFAGEDSEYNNDDDAVSDPEVVSAGQDAVLEFTAPEEPGTYPYQCDFHPTDMKGEIEVE